MLGRSEHELLGEGFIQFVDPEERGTLRATYAEGDLPSEMIFHLTNRFGETRCLEAHLTDLRGPPSAASCSTRAT
jgi:hypothetical protein